MHCSYPRVLVKQPLLQKIHNYINLRIKQNIISLVYGNK